MSTDPLLQPYQLRHLTLRNRILSTAHEPAYGEDGMPKDRYRRYHVEKARGGVALTMTAGSALVAPDSPAAFGNLHAYDDAIVPWLRALTDECHAHGAAVMIQITHLGRRTSYAAGDWLPVVSASAVREAAHRSHPKAAEDWDLDRIVAQYADAAERMQAAGMDGIEVEAYGHLLDSFWSPATNRRDDDYGGSLDNRLRLTHRVLDAIRARVGPGMIVGVRMVADEDWEGGLGAAEGVEIARRLVATGQVDFLNIIRGHIDSDAALVDVIPLGGMRASPHLDFAGEVRAATRFPVFHAARINDVATARHAIASGKLDMVGMTRAHLADPHLVAKIAAGREAEIRPCVGATYCLDRIYQGGGALCIHNPATGREGTMPHTIPRAAARRRVVVVGAGPAGLEAARVAAERGHEVRVFEAAAQPGGQVRLAARSRRRAELIGIVDWRVARLAALGVPVACNRYMEAEDVLALDPDVVLVATGGLPDTDICPGAALAASTWDVLSGDVVPGGAARVLVYDDHGDHQAMQAAEALAQAGCAVEIVTPERTLAVEVGGMNHVPYARAFAARGVRVTLNTRLTGLARQGNGVTAALGSDYGGAGDSRDVDLVVIEHGTTPADELYWALKPLSSNGGAVDQAALVGGGRQGLVRNRQGRFQLFRLGDAVASRNIHAAVFDGLRFAKDL